jgi:hypothetical protein
MLFPFATPALLIRTVGSPKCALISDDADAIDAGEARSHLKNLTVGCAVDILAVPSSILPRAVVE